MSLASAIRTIHRNHLIYVNPDLTDDIRLLSYGGVRRKVYREESDLLLAFDDIDFPTLEDDPDSQNGPGRLVYSESQVSGNLRITGELGQSETFDFEDEEGDFDAGMSNARRYSGDLDISFGRRGSFLFSYSNFTHQKKRMNRRFSDVIEDLFREPGDDWKKSYHLVTGRIVAESASLLYSTSRNVDVTLQVEVTSNRELEVNRGEMSLGSAQDMGLQITGGLSSSSTSLGSIVGDEGCVPVLEFHKLKGVRRRLNMEAVR